MKAYDVVGYAFDGAIYCVDHCPGADETGCRCRELDENGVCPNNCHGYGPNPIFADQLEGEEVCDVENCGGLV